MARPAKAKGYTALVDFKDRKQYGDAFYQKGDVIEWTDQERLDKAAQRGLISKAIIADEWEEETTKAKKEQDSDNSK